MRFAVAAAILVVFALDLFVPAGTAVAVPYVVVVLLAFWLPERRAILKTAALVTALAVIGFYFPQGFVTAAAVHNRLVTVAVIWLAAVLGEVMVRARESMRREHEFNECLIETAPIVILLLDASGRIVHWNRHLTAVTGVPKEEVERVNWIGRFVSEHSRGAAAELLQRCLDEDEKGSCELPLVTREGTIRHFSWSCRPIWGAAEDDVSILLVGQEITSLLEAQQRAVAAERLAAIGETISVVSHESRNELHMLQVGLDILGMSNLDARAQKAVEHMQASHARLLRHFDDLRHFAGPIRLERTECSLRAIWRAAWSSLESSWRDRDAVLEDEAEANETVRCLVDALRIEQVFRNLFENSLAACDDPARIELRCACVERDRQPHVVVTVRDNGPGLSPEAGAHVFDAFYTTKQQGTGLGMAISRRIVEAHGGELSLGKEAIRGAEFCMRLPLEAWKPACVRGQAADAAGAAVEAVAGDGVAVGEARPAG